MSRIPTGGLAALALLVAPAWGQTSQTEPVTFDAALTAQQQLDAWLDTQPLFSGSVRIARDGEVVALRDIGWADRETDTPVTAQTVFSIASVGKMVTAIAIQQLATDDRLTLETPVVEWLPEFAGSLDISVTIDHLLTHTSGLPRLTGLDDATLDTLRSNADMITLLTSEHLSSDGPARFAYRNINFILLGEIIARASGQTYEAYVAEHIAGQVGIETPLFIRENRAGPHAVARAYLPVDYETWWNSEDDVVGASAADYRFTTPQITALAGGGSYASADDMLALAQALRDGRLIPDALLAEGCGLSEAEIDTRGYGRGCSWRVGTYGHRVGHSGSTAGVQARFFLYWEAGVDVIILSNHEMQAAPLFSEIDAALQDGWLSADAPH